MFLQLKSGYDADAGPSWIGRVRVIQSWRSDYFQGRTLRRLIGTAYANLGDSNFCNVESDEGFWISGPKRDQSDARYSNNKPTFEEDVRLPYEAFLGGGQLRGRENG
jgi:hypothetical protein